MIFQSHSHTHNMRPLTTAHLAQTMTLLGLTTQELRQKVDAELASNPALELVEERRCPTCKRPLVHPGPCPVCSRPPSLDTEQPIVYVSARDDFYTGAGRLTSEEMPDDNLAVEVDSLPTFVLRQIATELAPADRPLAAHILTSLDEDGLLTTPLIEIARYHHVLLSRVEAVLRLIQRAEPVGVGSPTPQAALLVQLEVLSETSPVPEHTAEAIRLGMDLLSRRQYIDLAHRLNISTLQAREIARFITENLNPFPARAHWGEIHEAKEPGQDVYHQPDVIISYLNGVPRSPLVVEIVSPIAGTLRINPLFRQSLQQAPVEKSEAWQTHLEQASLLVKCLQQRDHTMIRLMQRIAVFQRAFILNGDAHLQPLTRASLADELGVHESTISRAVSSKAVQLPNGRIVPMARFFDRSLHIRTALRELVEKENRPLTDTQLANLLGKMGFPVARRTVAKYRSMEGILPAHLRTA